MSTERQAVLQRACDFLARREHSRKELKHKLSRGCEDESLIDELLDKLASEGLQSDARFTESFVHHRVNKGQGPIRIEQELHLRGIDPGIIDTCLHSGSIDWQELAANIRARKFGADIPRGLQDKAKQARFLHSRGFGGEVINRVLK